MRQHDGLADRQAKTMPRHRRARCVAAEEGLEDLVAIRGGDARTAIRHDQFHFVLGRDAGRDVNWCVRRRVLDRVLQ